jgi:hypothetical protein
MISWFVSTDFITILYWICYVGFGVKNGVGDGRLLIFGQGLEVNPLSVVGYHFQVPLEQLDVDQAGKVKDTRIRIWVLARDGEDLKLGGRETHSQPLLLFLE